MPEIKRPYSQVADFADLPSALHYLWYTFHFLPNSFSDQRTQQILTSDCVKSILLVAVNSAHQSVDDYCFNLTCRLCYNKFKSLKTTNAALLTYICFVFSKVQSTPKTQHSTLDETCLVGRFPLPSKQVIESCLQFYETRPQATKQVARRQDACHVLVRQETSSFSPFPRVHLSRGSLDQALVPPALSAGHRSAPNPVRHDLNPDLSSADAHAAQVAYDRLGEKSQKFSGPVVTGTYYPPDNKRSRSRSPRRSMARTSSISARSMSSEHHRSPSRSRSRSPSSSRDTQLIIPSPWSQPSTSQQNLHIISSSPSTFQFSPSQ